MIILDTNVVSELMAEAGDPGIAFWLDQQTVESVWITAITVFEIRYGLALLADGRRKSRLLELFATLLSTEFANRILNFDRAAAEECAVLYAARRQQGRPVEVRDAMIAGIARARRSTLATRNSKDFMDMGIALVNPWQMDS